MLIKKDIVNSLRSLGLTTGDKVLLHSSLSSIGKVDGGAETVVNAFLEVVGESGTLLVPAFGKLGIITEIVKSHPQAVISDCPLGTVAAIGPDAEALGKDHWKAETVHGADTPYTRLAEAGGYICLLGVDQDRNTSLHTVEALLRLPYLEEKTIEKFSSSEGEQTKTWPFYPGPHRDFIGLDRIFRMSGRMAVGQIGNAVTRLIPVADLLAIGQSLGEEDPAFCLCRNPNCQDCVTQRAAITKAMLDNEPYTLVVAASLAGYYIEEIIDNMRDSGVDKLELDQLKGKPVAGLTQELVVKACQELTAAGIEVVSLRSAVVPGDFAAFVATAAACGVNRIVIPLNAAASTQTELAGNAGIKVSFANIIDSGAGASNAIAGLPGAGFTFNPANFAGGGEKPFLRVFHAGRFHKYIDQLDVCDGLFSGRPTELAMGNSEIKELISILRCSSFGGIMSLTTENTMIYEDCREAVSAFCQLLEEM
jgi:aminoglycoside 3-N-acetyltransferase